MKQKLNPMAAVAIVVVVLGAIFGVMYFLSEAPVQEGPLGPNFGAGGGPPGSGGPGGGGPPGGGKPAAGKDSAGGKDKKPSSSPAPNKSQERKSP